MKHQRDQDTGVRDVGIGDRVGTSLLLGGMGAETWVSVVGRDACAGCVGGTAY